MLRKKLTEESLDFVSRTSAADFCVRSTTGIQNKRGRQPVVSCWSGPGTTVVEIE